MLFTYDDTKLMELFEQLSPKNRKKSLRGAMSRAGTKVRKEAINNLRGSIKTDKDLEKGVRRVTYRKVLGFRVTIGSKRKGKRGGSVWTDFAHHLNRRGELKPVLIWAEGGTKRRDTQVYRRKYKRLNRGYMPAYGFMEKTKHEVAPQVEAIMKEEIVKNIQRIARKYGCTVT